MRAAADTKPVQSPVERWRRSSATLSARRPTVAHASASHPASEGWRVVAEWDSALHGGVTYGQIAERAQPYLDAGDEVHVDLRLDGSAERLVVATLRVRTPVAALTDSDRAHQAAEDWGGA